MYLLLVSDHVTLRYLYDNDTVNLLLLFNFNRYRNYNNDKPSLNPTAESNILTYFRLGRVLKAVIYLLSKSKN